CVTYDGYYDWYFDVW
nr:immunoglobulin heavy chain junction region [Mus musculus]